MKQDGPVVAIGDRHRFGICKKLRDLSLDCGGVFQPIDSLKIPIVGLLFPIDEKAAVFRVGIGGVRGDPQVEGDDALVGMGLDADGLAAVPIYSCIVD